MVYGNLDLIPPRLPEPPDEINRQYMQDLVRALELFINQQQSTEVAENSESISWFVGQ